MEPRENNYDTLMQRVVGLIESIEALLINGSPDAEVAQQLVKTPGHESVSHNDLILQIVALQQELNELKSHIPDQVAEIVTRMLDGMFPHTADSPPISRPAQHNLPESSQ